MKLKEIAEKIGANLRGDGELEIEGVAKLEEAGPAHLSLYTGGKFKKLLEKTKARALIVPPGIKLEGFSLLEAENPRLAFAKAVELFHPRKRRRGIHPTAVIEEGVQLGRDVFIGAHVYIGKNCRIGDGTEIHAGCVIYEDVEIGQDCIIYARVVIREGTRVGNKVIIHPGAVIGADGFGFARDSSGKYHKIPQVGRVIIEDEVEIGANTCIDRAALGVTRIGKGSKIDNLCQIAHGVVIGQNTVIAGMSGIGGSTKIGSDVVVGGYVGITDNAEIGDRVIIAGKTGVTGDVPPGSIIAGIPHTDMRTWRRAMVLLYQLPSKLKDVLKGKDKG